MGQRQLSVGGVRVRVEKGVEASPPAPERRVLSERFAVADVDSAVWTIARHPLVGRIPRAGAVEVDVALCAAVGAGVLTPGEHDDGAVGKDVRG